MLSSILGSRQRRPSSGHSTSISPHARTRLERDGPYRDAPEDRQEYFPIGEEDGNGGGDDYEEDDEEIQNEDEENRPLLPIFDATQLDRIPIYSTTHAVRLLIVHRVETTLSWDQLRSPQVSQFLVKPIQKQILDSHFSRATLYILMANCLQFKKEMQQNPGLIGVNRTRAMICELLAMRLLKEYSVRELIDALSYDFDPLQDGSTPQPTGVSTPHGNRPAHARPARISTIEVAIRAQAKRLLAHPLVVQQLEAIWAGTIVFHSAADSLHRAPAEREQERRERTSSHITPQFSFGTFRGELRLTKPPHDDPISMAKRAVTIYSFRNASLFKLSRLRVGRYRQFFTTCSFGAMLGLLVAILVRRSQYITAMEIVFWFFSAGFMLAEVAEFTEQGSGLFFMSFWNVFDIISALLFVVYYALRLYGIFLPTDQRRHNAYMAHDILASTAVLLFPRLFSVLDHYYYFSQLLIALRAMAWDLVAVMILIIISCSGFFVAFTFSFSEVDFHARDAIYALFQILMGFTPAAWNLWPNLNLLGKAIMALFLVICHFLVVTVLITVLTNSFMAVVQNAQEEHQFLFAINTMSMVKSDALFSYIPPMNLVGWLLAPMRYLMPFRRFVKINRTAIKITHFPILFSVFMYERLFLARLAVESMDLVEQQGRATTRLPAFSIRGPTDILSPGHRVREPSVTTFRKDQALAAVFHHPYAGTSRSRVHHEEERSAALQVKSQTVVQDWMQTVGQTGASPPQEEARSLLERLETRRPPFRRTKTAYGRLRTSAKGSGAAQSFASDPEDALSRMSAVHPIEEEEEPELDTTIEEIAQHTDHDGEGDDERGSNDDDDADEGTEGLTPEPSKTRIPGIGWIQRASPDNLKSSTARTRAPLESEKALQIPGMRALDATEDQEPSLGQDQRPRRHHNRNLSTNTILYNPTHPRETKTAPISRSTSPYKRQLGSATPGAAAKPRPRTPRRPPGGSSSNVPAISGGASRPRPVMPPSGLRQSSSNIAGFLALERRRPSFSAMALDLASDLGDNRYGPDANVMAAMPASFSTNMEALAAAQRRPRANPPAWDFRAGDGVGPSGASNIRAREWDREREKDRKERRRDEGRMSRIMLARMTTLEEGFREVLREVKGWRREGEARSGATSLGSAEDVGRRDFAQESTARSGLVDRAESETFAEREDWESGANVHVDRSSV
ncbi:hypothetical protein P152DRAFT_475685 [Eremomyces bilateralis CBS 781.70]|uniref:Ion transport domain-containing protein n=1 Tax=Eremomyces bilateralis CBS 781.70 TaxID=1392243 RepID=A0A6G1FXR1_9PEZI|nr:uncharacterized protein P152DRAFT_475685 [Eremomyces bilateralis CBS 781.70]KAF1810471.1 hypothetical protein P152DRAFT_475685 [Eremomyces bilateralis CBS 781.70]